MKKFIFPPDQVFWYLPRMSPEILRDNITADVVIIGGGMAGLSAAQAFAQKGCKTVLIEKTFCGAGASGKSSGFITPDSELGLGYFMSVFGKEKAKKLWEFVTGGDDIIKHNIKHFGLQCDQQIQDTLVVANSKRSVSEIKKEHNSRKALHYDTTYYSRQELSSILGCTSYYAGVRYPGTFGISAYLYCQGMKEALNKQSVIIYEESPALTIEKNRVYTPQGTVEADHIVVCVDRYLPEIAHAGRQVFPVQTFIMVSAPLQDNDVKKIFPEKPCMVWDTDMIYQYYRLIEGNRFLIGGSDLLAAFWGREEHNNYRIMHKLEKYVRTKFPQVSMTFEYFWPGMIGVSKDIMPLAGFDPDNEHVYYIAAATGLPWAAALGRYSAERIIDHKKDYDEFFSFERRFPLGPLGTALQYIAGKRLTFALSNFISMYIRTMFGG